MTFSFKFDQVFIASIPLVGQPLETLPCHFSIEQYVLDQELFTDIIVLRPYESENQQIHPSIVEVSLEFV